MAPGLIEGWFISTPNNGAGLPPTEVGQALVKAWLQHPNIISDTDINSGILVQGIVPGITIPNLASQLAPIWASVCFLLEGVLVPPAWVTKNEMNILANARLTSTVATNLKYEHLFLEATSESKTKWRFLSLYRILEHGYLDEIFQTLSLAFFSSPKQSLSNASKSVENEMNQFLALATKASLQNYFETLYDEFDYAKTGGNQFAVAVFASIDPKVRKWEKGVFVCYKIRCAIVHAGLSAPIFDAYSDGPELLEILLPTFESIALSFLGVSIV